MEAAEDEETRSDYSVHLFHNLQTRAETLLREFRTYQAHLKSQKKQQEVEIRAFKRGIESEVKTLEKLRRVFVSLDGTAQGTVGPEDEQDKESPQLHALRSSNLPFYEAVWDVAKSCRSLTALGKKMYFAAKEFHSPYRSGNEKTASRMRGKDATNKRAVIVDIVANGGLDWIKVSTLTEKRLLFEMAKEGWEKYADFFEDSDADSDAHAGAGSCCKNGTKLELVRLAEELNVVAEGVRVAFRHPQIRFVLPKIREGVVEDVDAFLADLRATGAIVQCSDEMDKVLEGPRLELDRLMPAATIAPLTSTINVDCTILLALISDISHLSRHQLSLDPVGKSQTYHKAITNQIQAEESAPMLPEEIYPLLAGRDLECTHHAAQRMREIVQCMGTSSERSRADVLLGGGQYKDRRASILRQAFSEKSMHRVPDDLRLPVKVVNFDVQELLSSEPRLMTPAARSCKPFPSSTAVRAKDMLQLTPINASVFLYAWARQITTLTSNRTVTMGLLKTINNILDSDERQGCGHDAEFVGPLIYTCETARSLIGKSKSQ